MQSLLISPTSSPPPTGGGVDYASSNGVSVRITNRIEICARVNITNDTEPENTETLAVRFIQGSSGNPLRCALTVEVQILDNDGPATIMPTETSTYYCSSYIVHTKCPVCSGRLC